MLFTPPEVRGIELFAHWIDPIERSNKVQLDLFGVQ